MKRIIRNIKDQIPKYQNGFSFRKSQELFIPYLEIGVECLIRDVSEINLFFETILKLIEIEVKDVSEISKILGVSFEITKEAIVDMIEGDYVGVSENILRITRKGKEALKTKQLIEIKKRNINKVMIDLITGDIHDGNSAKYHRIKKNELCLEKQIDVSKTFLDSNYNSINNVFQHQQEGDSSFGKSSVNKELYKIIDISYQNLVYVKNELFIYENDDSDEIQIQLQNDINDQYLNCLYKQLKEETHPCLESFFEKSIDFIKQHSDISTNFDEKLIDVTGKLCSDLRHTEDLDNFSLEAFMQKRYMLTDKEYINYFTLSDEITFDKLIIITNRVNSVLTTTIFEEIKRIAIKKPVVLIYDKNEFNVTKVLNYYLGTEKNNRNIISIASEGIVDTKIFFGPFLEINIEEKIINAFGKAITYKSGVLEFNGNYKKENLKNVLDIYKIDDLIHRRIFNKKVNKNVKKK